jgi:hypothetical protein
MMFGHCAESWQLLLGLCSKSGINEKPTQTVFAQSFWMHETPSNAWKAVLLKWTAASRKRNLLLLALLLRKEEPRGVRPLERMVA